MQWHKDPWEVMNLDIIFLSQRDRGIMSEHVHVKDAIKCINLGHPNFPNM